MVCNRVIPEWVKNRAEFELNTCSSKTPNNFLQHGHEICVDMHAAFIASIPVFTSSVTKLKHTANLEGRGRGTNFEA